MRPYHLSSHGKGFIAGTLFALFLVYMHDHVISEISEIKSDDDTLARNHVSTEDVALFGSRNTVPLDERVPGKRVMVLVSHSEGKDVSFENLKFFIDFGIVPAEPPDEIEYRIIVNGIISQTIPPFPTLPNGTNARLVHRENVGYDICAYAQEMQGLGDSFNHYTHWIYINTSVRGPFLPVYYKRPWYEAMISQLQGGAVISGPYINCEISPHVQSFAMAANKKGAELLREAWGCWNDKMKVVTDGEVGGSRTAQERGYSISSLLASQRDMRLYRGNGTTGCVPARNHKGNPTFEKEYYGLNPHPFEVIFVKNAGTVREWGRLDKAILDQVEMYTRFMYEWKQRQAKQ
mmetsp:Transcript_44792/g.72944  ORF Transcript_44792/g.72944 Transcript_44792/m.72944 type:complete len:348 (-) Transcript_44792:855-1898(-)|eukprot:CAMPEP_0184646754 /NCGR_PEP_ID=MMETSP0308-20130426/3534_1 /TAXON_ID=38269 /ORGANISM="Gloeochaete witrockiana, Strain SAG 46.84" /LENGTH=347 /DNA_ID=CAMNT_0027077083 /DNA_START=58 /DNA_END=1101 /DNA_ORIENTATION=+